MRALSQVEVEDKILECISDLEEATDEYGGIASEAAQAEVAHKLGYARALVRGPEGSVALKEAWAQLQCETEFTNRKTTEARLSAQKELLSTLRARLDALRTLSASIRGQV